ncbi:MAG: hypothetical protein QNK05_13675 [Myxococcota bacterium]|nr:hypothetical protein [Myxococcota bacterium]
MSRTPTFAAMLALALLAASASTALPPRERAIEQIPELMGRILDSQEEIRAQETALEPRITRYEQELLAARSSVESANSEEEAAEALTDYVESYAARIEVQQAGLEAIHGAVVRMRADARELARAAKVARGRPGETAASTQAFFQDQFQGVAAATSTLADRLDRTTEAATAGAVLHASWASHAALGVEVPELGPDGALTFARKVEGLFAQWQARSQQLRAERQAVRRLLDLLIERQLANRLDTLFEGADGAGIGTLFASVNGSGDWGELGSLVARTLGLPNSGGAPRAAESRSLGRLDFFATGSHRQ